MRVKEAEEKLSAEGGKEGIRKGRKEGGKKHEPKRKIEARRKMRLHKNRGCDDLEGLKKKEGKGRLQSWRVGGHGNMLALLPGCFCSVFRESS